MRQLRSGNRRRREQRLRPVLAPPAGVAHAADDLAYHSHDRLDEATYEEHAHAGNTARHDHPAAHLGPRWDHEN